MCTRSHKAKLLLVTRQLPQHLPPCHRLLRRLKDKLVAGVPLETALAILRQQFSLYELGPFDDGLLSALAKNVHYVPLARVQIAGYLNSRGEALLSTLK